MVVAEELSNGLEAGGMGTVWSGDIDEVGDDIGAFEFMPEHDIEVQRITQRFDVVLIIQVGASGRPESVCGVACIMQ